MTIDIQILSAADISINNEVINVSCARGNDGEVLSAASFLVEGASHDSLGAVLGFVFELIGQKLPGHEMWLFLANSAWQPDTRIVRYRRLWRALKLRGIEIIDGSGSQELVVGGDGSLKFFGAVRLSELSIGSVIKAIVDERCSYVAALPKGFDVGSILHVGWSGNITADVDFYYCVCARNGLIFKAVGEFDDCERGFGSMKKYIVRFIPSHCCAMIKGRGNKNTRIY